jgi:quercetin dioxygenase-like cupin family protein
LRLIETAVLQLPQLHTADGIISVQVLEGQIKFTTDIKTVE